MRKSSNKQKKKSSRSKKYRGINGALIQANNKVWPSLFTGSFHPGIGFPDRLRCNLRYVEGQGFSASATPAAQVYRMNSLFDPNLTGTGHQPEYYDSLTPMYGEYLVLGAKARLEFVNTGIVPTYIVVALMDQNNSGLSAENISESRYALTKTLGALTGSGVTVIEVPYMSTAHMNGERGNIETDPNFYTIITTNPSDQWFMVIKVASTDGITAVALNYRVVIEFNCIFRDLTPVTGS